jgi:spermidine/putrescine transport system permease protein
MSQRKYLIIPFILTLLFLTAGPMGILVSTSFMQRGALGGVEPIFSTESYATLFDPLYLKIFLNTGIMALMSALGCLIVAYPFAFYLSRLEPEKRSLILTCVLIPFWTSFLIRILSFMDLLRIQFFGVDLLYSQWGVWLCMIYNYLPFAILPLYSTMEKIPNSMFEAARDLGSSKYQTFLWVLWPLSKTGVVTAFSLVFIPSLGEYLIPELVGGGKDSYLGSFLHSQFLTARNWPFGAAAIAILLGLSFFMVVAGLRNEEKSVLKNV